MQFSLVARTRSWEKDDVELATVWVWKSYDKSSNFVSISCVPGFEMEHKFHKTYAWGLMLLCPPKKGFERGSTSILCSYIFSSVESNKEVLENSHTSKHGDIKI